jgi:hypothetical protein
MLLTEPTYNRACLTRRLAGEDSESEGNTQRITDLDDSRGSCARALRSLRGARS